MIPTNIKSYYELHSKFYDVTRWTFLFGRNALPKYFPSLRQNSKILDLGCGTGKHLHQLRKKYPNSEIIGLDQSSAMLSKVTQKPSYNLFIENYSTSNFPDNSFDLIICSYSLTMFDDLEQALFSLKNHLKPNGTLLVLDFDSTPFSWFSKWMKKNHVSFEPNLFQLLKNNFTVEFKESRKAYFGLYYYSIYAFK